MEFKKPLLLLCCSMYLSSPLLAIVANNETGETITCFKGTTRTALPETIKDGASWKQKCNFMKTPDCKFYCTYKGQSNGYTLIINAFNANNKYEIIKGKENKPVFKPIK